MADIISSGVANPIMVYGRAPNGQLQAVTTDGAGNLSIAGGGSLTNFAGVPTGACTNGTTAVNTITGDLYTCKNLVWVINPYSATAGSFYPGITMFGTSLTSTCNGASLINNCYSNLLANDVGGGVFRNWGRNGDMIADTARLWVFPQVIPQTTGNAQYTLEIGVNEANFTGGLGYNTADKQANYVNMLNATIAWLAIPRSNILTGANCTQTSGSWAIDNATYSPNALLMQSTTNGSVLTCTYTSTGNTIYLWYRMIDGDAGAASVTLDGVAAGTFSGTGQNGAAISTINGTTNSVGVLKITNTPGSHAVAITVTSATGAGNVVSILGVGSAPALTEYNLPTVYVMGVIKEQTDQNSAATLLFNGFNSTAVTAAANDGLNVKFVDARSYINPATDYADQLHPNDLGNSHLRDAFEFSMRPSGLAAGLGAQINTNNLLTLYDTFVRSNGALGNPNWAGATNLTVTGNIVLGTSNGNFNLSGKPGANNPGSFTNGWFNSVTNTTNPYAIGRDQYSRIRVAAAVGTGAVLVRVLDNPPVANSGAFYQYDCSSTARRILRNVNTVLATVAASCNVGDIMELQVQNSTNGLGVILTSFLNGTQDLQSTDTLAAPYGFPTFGIVSNSTAGVNNWSGGSLSPIASLDMTQEWKANQLFQSIGTRTNCSSSASPAVCGSAASGSVAVPTGATPTLQINTTAVTANSQIYLTIDESLGTKLGVTCNSTLATLVQPVVTARTPGTSFTIQVNATLAANPACVSYSIIN